MPVTISISKEELRKILDKRNGNFPPLFSNNMESCKTIFNTHLETVAQLAGIDRLDYGRVWDEEKKYFAFGDNLFYKMISFHVCRRTFATMCYINWLHNSCT